MGMLPVFPRYLQCWISIFCWTLSLVSEIDGSQTVILRPAWFVLWLGILLLQFDNLVLIRLSVVKSVDLLWKQIHWFKYRPGSLGSRSCYINNISSQHEMCQRSHEMLSEVNILIIVIGLENLSYTPYWRDSSLLYGNALLSAGKLLPWVHILNGSICRDKNGELTIFITSLCFADLHSVTREVPVWFTPCCWLSSALPQCEGKHWVLPRLLKSAGFKWKVLLQAQRKISELYNEQSCLKLIKFLVSCIFKFQCNPDFPGSWGTGSSSWQTKWLK